MRACWWQNTGRWHQQAARRVKKTDYATGTIARDTSEKCAVVIEQAVVGGNQHRSRDRVKLGDATCRITPRLG